MTDSPDETASPEAPLDDASSLEDHPLTHDRVVKYRKVMEDGGFPYAFRRTATAHDIVREIRRGEFFTDDGFAPRDPIFEAIGGAGIIAAREESE